MELASFVVRIEEKISRLAEARNELRLQLAKAREDNESLFRINSALQEQVNELLERNRELEESRSLQSGSPNRDNAETRQRISELVNEIDECIAMLKQG
ncbi:MAG: hypothetical protein RL220_969 [Bacteroidota bacterium]|jgi:chromosome segregation ATPase